MTRVARLHPGACADILQIARFIARRVSPTAAARWQARIGAAINRLEAEADRWPEAEEAADLGLDLRVMFHGRRPHVYRVLFTIDGQAVNVLRVRHAAQERLAEGDV